MEAGKNAQTAETYIMEPICGELLQFTVIRSSRKTLGLEIKRDGSLLARAPMRMSKKRISEFIRKKEHWIHEHRQKLLQRQEEKQTLPEVGLTEQQKRELMKQAAGVFAEKVSGYAKQIGVSYGKITIRDQKTRWGSCSSKGNLNFNFRLLLAPQEVLDYVVVHELCHRKQMNHSDAFWAEVEAILPDYRTRKQWLKENGWRLMQALISEK